MKLAIDAITTRPGGTLTALIGYLRAWKLAGCSLDVTVLASVPGTIAQLEQARLNCRIEPVLVGQGIARRVMWHAVGMRRWIARQRSDVLLASTHFVSGLSIPQVVHHHNLWRFVTPDLDVPPRSNATERLRDWAARRALDRAERNVFVSEFLRAQAMRFAAERSETYLVMPNGVDDALIEAERRASASRDLRAARAPRLVAVQSANVQKDNPTLLRTLAALVQRAPQIDWRLQIAGSAGRAAWIPFQQLARQLGIDQRIDWLGFLNADELRACQRDALCLVASSRFESSGLPLIEGMSASCPVVASRIPAFEEYAQSAAELVVPGDAEAFAEAVLRVYEDGDRRAALIEAGLERAWHYRWSQWAPLMAQAVQDAAGRGVRN